MAKQKPSLESEHYGKVKEDFFITAFTWERGCHTLVELIEEDRWKTCGDYANFEEFLDSLCINKLKASLEDQKRLALLIKAKQPQISNTKIAKGTGLKRRTLDRALALAGSNDPKQAKKPKENKRGGGSNGPSGDEAANTVARAQRIKDRQNQVDDRIAKVSFDAKKLGKFSLILADPPWADDFGPNRRSTENHYPTMSIEDIYALPVSDIAHEQAMLFLWATSAMLEMALATVKAWGFQYRTQMVWVKPSIGLGQYVRQRHELLLVCRRGDHPAPNATLLPDSVIEAPRLEHSEKPEVFHQIIERMYPPATKIELFRRGDPREGWSAWGAETIQQQVQTAAE